MGEECRGKQARWGLAKKINRFFFVVCLRVFSSFRLCVWAGAVSSLSFFCFVFSSGKRGEEHFRLPRAMGKDHSTGSFSVCFLSTYCVSGTVHITENEAES